MIDINSGLSTRVEYTITNTLANQRLTFSLLEVLIGRENIQYRRRRHESEERPTASFRLVLSEHAYRPSAATPDMQGCEGASHGLLRCILAKFIYII